MNATKGWMSPWATSCLFLCHHNYLWELQLSSFLSKSQLFSSPKWLDGDNDDDVDDGDGCDNASRCCRLWLTMSILLFMIDIVGYVFMFLHMAVVL